MAAPKTPKAKAAPATAEAQSEQPTATYIVGSCPVLHDGDLYQPGFDIELTDEQAKHLGALVRLAPTEPEPPLE